MDEDKGLTELLERVAERHAPAQDALERTIRRGRRRQNRVRVFSGAVALAIAAAGIGVATLAFVHRGSGPLVDSRPSVTITPSQVPPSILPFPGNPVPAPVKVVSSSRNRLIVESPPGVYRWSFTAVGCSVTGRPIGGGSGGGFGGGCGGNAYLGYGDGSLGGEAAQGGGSVIYDVLCGRTLPTPGIMVRVTLEGGSALELTPHDGLWIVVVPAHYAVAPTRPSSGDRVVLRASPFRAIDVLDASGKVIAHIRLPNG